jgi:hypothetical protein
MKSLKAIGFIALVAIGAVWAFNKFVGPKIGITA